MKRKLIFKTASLLFKYAFPIYKIFYYRFKKKQDAFEIELVKNLVKKGDHVLDIGANIGFYSGIISNLVGENGKVHCFEPDELNFKYLSKNVNGKKNIELIKKAIAENDGQILLYTSDQINVENTTYKPEHFESTYAIEKTSVDNYVQQKFPVSFIKMDIQGAELKALEGMKQTLLANKDVVLMTEVWPYGLKNCGNTPEEIINFIQALNLKIFLIDESSIKELKAEDVQGFKAEETFFYNILVTRNLPEAISLLN
ncbi:MAG TPA: FkbM family methyltransferase [Bacteroidia bacterium]|nr:FkbM family methyltransferase [Bacteroidia bacterium]